MPVSHDDIQRAKFFDQFSSDFTNSIVDFLELETFVAGDTVMSQGEVGDKLFFLFRGSVDVLVGESEDRVATLEAGSVFGEMSLIGQRKRTATIRANEFCDCRSLDQRIFQRVLRKYPEDRLLLEQMARKRWKELGFMEAPCDGQRRASAPHLPALHTERRNRAREDKSPNSKDTKRSTTLSPINSPRNSRLGFLDFVARKCDAMAHGHRM